jgi:hypothetical protein
MKRALILVVFCLACTLNGCGIFTTQVAGKATPPLPSRQFVFATVTQSPGSIPTRTPHLCLVPTLTPNLAADRTAISTSTSTPYEKKLISPSPQPQPLHPLDPIQIRSPGDGSEVASPIPLEIQLDPDEGSKILRIELRGEDGTLLVRKLIDMKIVKASGGNLVDPIDFEIPGESQNGLLIVQVEQTADLPLAINSVDLVLLSSGLARIPPPSWQFKAIDIQQPAPGIEGREGMITISGLTRLDATKPLKVQLIAQNGKIVGQRLAGVGASPDDVVRPFSTQVPYKVDQRTNAWVVVFRDDGPNGEITHLASLPIVLNP